MSSDVRLILKRQASAERWEDQERGDYDLDRFREEFRKHLYSARGRELLQSRDERSGEPDREPSG
ncbi:MAG: hypothetical protein AAB225_05145 [Acidobacteriota bacterium]